ncbi:MAG: PEP-CTERM sorting domain-containing protein [Pirellulales bacterium]|nr:PEP-CTERM sorting domain-containing protein [Pirellulales bacterium]
MKRILGRYLWIAMLLGAICFLACPTSSVHAAIVWTGDVNPADPTTWTSNTVGFIGRSYPGAVTVDSGSSLYSRSAYLGSNYNSTGTVTVIGTGSIWINSDVLFIRKSNNSTLNVVSGGVVTAGTLYSSPTALFGDGIISTKGLVLDGNIYFDSIHGLQQTLSFGNGGKLNLNLDGTGFLGTGYEGFGTLRIAEGLSVTSSNGILGYYAGSTGIATVSGLGSEWINDKNLYIGRDGHGLLKIEDGGHVSSYYGFLGQSAEWNSGSGTVLVTGIGSMWTSNALYVGFHEKGMLNIEAGGQVSNTHGYLGEGGIGTATVIDPGSKWINTVILMVGSTHIGTLNIINGGEVMANDVIINSLSLLAIDVGRESKLFVNYGSGTLANSGKVRILAGASTTAGNVYSPISAGTWSGSGAYQAVGGTWNATSHEFTVSGVQAGNSGVALDVDLISMQRAMIEDGGSGWRLGASFLASATSKPLTFTATAISGGTLDALESLAGLGQTVLGGWTLKTTSGYVAGEPVYLSFDTGGRYSRELLQLWSYNGTAWTKFSASDVNFDGQYVNFTVTGMSTYAATVPEPGTAVLLVCGLMGLAAAWRRKRGKG